MLRTRGSRIALTALALAASASLAMPTAVAAPAPAPAAVPNSVPMVPEGVPVDAIAALTPAIVGAIAGPADIAEGPQAGILAQARTLLATLNLPPQIKATLERIITFLDGSGGGGPDLPEDGPAIAQFLYPTIGKGCIGDSSDSVGTALAVPGPAQLPPPGPAAGQTGFVFTALGTKSPTPVQNPPMTVQWLNLDTRQSGVVPLTDEAKINPDGPATLSAIVDTGRGRIVAVVGGSLTTQAPDAAPRTCSFLPTLGFFTVA
ncbi:hypothetical protein IU443_18505 [Nocardia farcinica]|nr:MULTISPECIES: hypothetical protein [Nocardia]AXK87925.1 hypothetical protein DXT66_21945 [Nocardia farcinica]MBA4858140.1 hypothetical protein [Nocardia farcinica]MBC9816670.1 hypothetical protein [Nocardia farcinica]MBF6069215.1 hypothetical protein [Nocardia farcinica]MBF6143360.1 hypothetical protein [Nocardia farcinica]